MVETENFEIVYLAEEGITGIKELKVDLPSEFGVRDLPYFINWGLLEEKIFETEGNFFKTVSGTAVIRGHYLVLRGSQSLIIEINSIIKDLMGPSVIYSSIQIT